MRSKARIPPFGLGIDGVEPDRAAQVLQGAGAVADGQASGRQDGVDRGEGRAQGFRNLDVAELRRVVEHRMFSLSLSERRCHQP